MTCRKIALTSRGREKDNSMTLMGYWVRQGLLKWLGSTKYSPHECGDNNVADIGVVR